MKEQFTYTTRGVCSRGIEITVDEGIVTEIRFIGGCSGNTQGVAALAVGMTPDEVIRRIKGIKCGFKSTSCPDQLATALEEYLAKKNA
jgi:uncharacterized protein (TIGR03905 family)